MIQEAIKERGLNSVQIQWEQLKTEMDNKFRQVLPQLERSEPALARIIKQNKAEMIQTIENDLYPERKKNKGGSGWIWFLVIGGVVVVGIIAYFILRKKKQK